MIRRKIFIVTESINIDTLRKNSKVIVAAKQGDTKTRSLIVTMCQSGTPIKPDPEKTVVINAERADGTAKSFACRVVNGQIIAPLTGWMLELSGVLRCSISILTEDGGRLSSMVFYINVEPAEVTDINVEEDERCDVLAELVIECKELKSDLSSLLSAAGSAADSANSAAAAANAAAKAASEAGSTKLDISAVVQVTGESETNVMSQKAVTDALAGRQPAGEYAYDGYVTSKEDADSIVNSGIYNYASSGAPLIPGVPGSCFANLLVFKNHHSTDSGYRLQIALPNDSGNMEGMYYRAQKGHVWQSWVRFLDMSNIVQAAGQSTTSIMSQKAVTDALRAISALSTNLLPDTQAFSQNLNISSVIISEKFAGFTVRHAKTADVYADMARWIDIFPPYHGCDYTFSFYAKGTGTLELVLYESSGSNAIPTVSAATSDGRVNNVSGSMTMPLPSEWQRIWIRWRLGSTGDLSQTKWLLARLAANSEAYICAPKLEIGAMPDPVWTPNPNDKVIKAAGQSTASGMMQNTDADEDVMAEDKAEVFDSNVSRSRGALQTEN